jgi:hypothetical protein
VINSRFDRVLAPLNFIGCAAKAIENTLPWRAQQEMGDFVPRGEVCPRGAGPSGVYDRKVTATSFDGTWVVEKETLCIARNEFFFEKTRQWKIAEFVVRKLGSYSLYVVVTGDKNEFYRELIRDAQAEIFYRIECPSLHHVANSLDRVFPQIPQRVIRCGELQIPGDLAEFRMAHEFRHSNTFL